MREEAQTVSEKTTYGLTAAERTVLEDALVGGSNPRSLDGRTISQRSLSGNYRIVEFEVVLGLMNKGLLFRNGAIWMPTREAEAQLLRPAPTVKWNGIAKVVKRTAAEKEKDKWPKPFGTRSDRSRKAAKK